jgi:hypothetical protein
LSRALRFILSCNPLSRALQYILLPYNPLSRALYSNSFQVCITSTSIPASLRCTCFDIARQISQLSCRHSGQTPPIVHVGHYGQPTVTAAQTFSLLSTPGVPTHRGENGGRDSTLDLVWHNLASDAQSSFQGAHIDWAGSLGSDHALIRTYAVPQVRLIRQREDRTNRFDQDIDPEQWEEWHAILEIELPHPRSPITSHEDIDALVDAIYAAYNNACAATMKRKGTAPGFNARWWNDDCKAAAHALRDATTPEHRT